MTELNARPHRLELIRGGDYQTWQATDLTTMERRPVAGCARQAATGYFGQGRLNIVEAVKMVHGVWVDCTAEDLGRCDVHAGSWVWQHHGWTHTAGPVRVERN